MAAANDRMNGMKLPTCMLHVSSSCNSVSRGVTASGKVPIRSYESAAQ
jgi:hypothetical protein